MFPNRPTVPRADSSTFSLKAQSGCRMLLTQQMAWYVQCKSCLRRETSTDHSLRNVEQQGTLPHLVRVGSSMAGGIRNSDAMALEFSARPRSWLSRRYGTVGCTVFPDKNYSLRSGSTGGAALADISPSFFEALLSADCYYCCAPATFVLPQSPAFPLSACVFLWSLSSLFCSGKQNKSQRAAKRSRGTVESSYISHTHTSNVMIDGDSHPAGAEHLFLHLLTSTSRAGPGHTSHLSPLSLSLAEAGRFWSTSLPRRPTLFRHLPTQHRLRRRNISSSLNTNLYRPTRTASGREQTAEQEWLERAGEGPQRTPPC